MANLLHTMVVQSVYDPEDADAPAKVERSLDWPEKAEREDLEQSDREAREALVALGIDPDALLASAQARQAAELAGSDPSSEGGGYDDDYR